MITALAAMIAPYAAPAAIPLIVAKIIKNKKAQKAKNLNELRDIALEYIDDHDLEAWSGNPKNTGGPFPYQIPETKPGIYNPTTYDKPVIPQYENETGFNFADNDDDDDDDDKKKSTSSTSNAPQSKSPYGYSPGFTRLGGKGIGKKKSRKKKLSRAQLLKLLSRMG